MILFVMLLFPIYYFFSSFALDTTNIESILPLQSGYTLTAFYSKTHLIETQT